MMTLPVMWDLEVWGRISIFRVSWGALGRSGSDSRRLGVPPAGNLVLRSDLPERVDRKGKKVLPERNALPAAIEDDAPLESASCQFH